MEIEIRGLILDKRWRNDFYFLFIGNIHETGVPSKIWVNNFLSRFFRFFRIILFFCSILFCDEGEGKGDDEWIEKTEQFLISSSSFLAINRMANNSDEFLIIWFERMKINGAFSFCHCVSFFVHLTMKTFIGARYSNMMFEGKLLFMFWFHNHVRRSPAYSRQDFCITDDSVFAEKIC